MGESARRWTDAEPQRAISAQEPPLAADDLLRLQEFVERAGGIEAARDLLETLAEILPDGDPAEIDLATIDEDFEREDFDCADNEDAGDDDDGDHPIAA